MAHLTTQRAAGNPEHTTWDFVTVGDGVRDVLRAFVAAADQSRLDSSVSHAIPEGDL